MGEYLKEFFRLITGDYFAPVIGLTYILIKIVLRHFIHRAIDHPYDFWGVIAWFSVDLTLLSLSVSAASNVAAKQQCTTQQTVLWYVTFGFSLLIAAFCYLFFVKRRDKLEKGKRNKKSQIRPYPDWGLGLYLSGGWLIGFAWFWATLRALK
jgi:hypothetical protein